MSTGYLPYKKEDPTESIGQKRNGNNMSIRFNSFLYLLSQTISHRTILGINIIPNSQGQIMEDSQ